jgi:hypothetical protein
MSEATPFFERLWDKPDDDSNWRCAPTRFSQSTSAAYKVFDRSVDRLLHVSPFQKLIFLSG